MIVNLCKNGEYESNEKKYNLILNSVAIHPKMKLKKIIYQPIK
jgi:hypothetical protein